MILISDMKKLIDLISKRRIEDVEEIFIEFYIIDIM